MSSRSTSDPGRVNRLIGKALGLGFVPAEQIFYFLIIFILCLPVMRGNLVNGILLFIVGYGTWWVLTGDKPYQILEQFHPPRRWLSVAPACELQAPAIPKAQFYRRSFATYRLMGKRTTVHYIEPQFQLLTYGQCNLQSRQVGYYLLQRGPNQLMFIFGWEVSGHDPSITEKDAIQLRKYSNQALRGLPLDVDLKVIDDAFVDDGGLQQQQQELLKLYPRNSLEYALVRSRQRRVQDLKQAGILLPRRIRVFAKYRVSLTHSYEIKRNWLEKLLAGLQPLLSKLQPNPEGSLAQWEAAIRHAFEYCYLNVESLLTSNEGFGMRVKPLSGQQLWADDWRELHRAEPPTVPQLLLLSENGLHQPVVNHSTHALGVLFGPEQGLSPVPIMERSCVYYPVKDQYLGFLQIGEVEKYSGEGDCPQRGAMRFLWNALRGTDSPVSNRRIITEINRDASGMEKYSIDRIITNSVQRQADAARKGTVDVVASRRQDEAIDARDRLEEDNQLFWASCGIWLYRTSPQELDQDLARLAQQFPTAVTERAWEVAEHFWLQSWPFAWSALLSAPHHRRQKYLSQQLVPLIPLMCPQPLDSRGTVFLTRESASPVCIDLCEGRNHLGIIATSRASKSVVLADIINDFFLRKYPVVVFDFPRPDGTSTYTDLVRLLNGLGAKAAYHDVRSSAMNILELPDLRGISDAKEYNDRLQAIRDYHVNVITTLVLGDIRDSTQELTVSSLVSQCYFDFMADSQIQGRYQRAIAAGFGTPDHQQTPTLEDFVAYAQPWCQAYLERHQDTVFDLSRQAIDLFLTQLRGILKTPLGRAIARPSSFDTDVDLLVIAMTGVNSNFETSIYALAGQGALLRKALSSRYSAFIVDEGTILFDRPAFARSCGQIAANGLKWGCHLILAAQTIEKIYNSCAGDDIFKNLNNLLVGHIQEVALSGLTNQIGLRPELLRPYASKAYQPSREHLRSNWYLKRNDQHLELHHYPSELLLSLSATDPDESAARQLLFQQYPDQSLLALIRFSDIYTRALRQNIPILHAVEAYVRQPRSAA
mgnify:CR=1 FL=1